MNQSEHDEKKDCSPSEASTNGVGQKDCSVGSKSDKPTTKGDKPMSGGACKRRPEAAREL